MSWKKQTSEAAHRIIAALSTTTVSSNSHGQQLSKWGYKLTTDQIDRILAIVHDVGVTGYTDALYPEPPMTFQ